MPSEALSDPPVGSIFYANTRKEPNNTKEFFPTARRSGLGLDQPLVGFSRYRGGKSRRDQCWETRPSGELGGHRERAAQGSPHDNKAFVQGPGAVCPQDDALGVWHPGDLCSLPVREGRLQGAPHPQACVLPPTTAPPNRPDLPAPPRAPRPPRAHSWCPGPRLSPPTCPGAWLSPPVPSPSFGPSMEPK